MQCTYAYRSVLRESRDRTLFLSARLSDLPDALLPFPAAVPSCVSVPESSDVSSYTFASRDDEREAASSPLALPRCECGQHKINYRDQLKEMAVLLSTTQATTCRIFSQPGKSLLAELCTLHEYVIVRKHAASRKIQRTSRVSLPPGARVDLCRSYRGESA